jgi:DNA-binding XRE family transcriptional regulator
MSRFLAVYADDVERILWAPSIDVAMQIAEVLRAVDVEAIWAE